MDTFPRKFGDITPWCNMVYDRIDWHETCTTIQFIVTNYLKKKKSY